MAFVQHSSSHLNLWKKQLGRVPDSVWEQSDLETLVQLCQNIAGRTVCAFGDAEVAPIMSTLKYWRSEYEELIQQAEAAGLIQLEPAAARH